MKKTLLLFLFLLSQFSAKAEDALQVVPFATTAGVTLDDGECFSLEMTNTHAYTAMEFHLYLPKGMTLDMDYPFDMNPDRFPGVTKRGVFYPNHDYDITNPSEGHYYIKIYNTKLETIGGAEGELLSFYYATADDMQPGYHLIKVTGAILGVDSHTGIYPEASVSWVKVGEPSANALLDLGTYDIPSFVQAHLPEHNVIINGVCANLVLADGYDFTAQDDFTATAASYSRPLAADWGTVCLPFGVTSDATVQYYKLSAVSESAMTFEPTATVSAGEPAVFKALDTDVLQVRAANVTVTADNADYTPEDPAWTMKGTYSAINNDPAECQNDIYYISDNKFWYADQPFAVAAFRGWFETARRAGARPLAFEILEDNQATDIDVVEHADGSAEIIFGINAQRRATMQKGINISNGKKIIKR